MILWKRAGTTLMELITVVMIAGILASIALPIYRKAMERSRNQEAITNLNLIKSAELIYYSENNTFWPASGSGAVSDINSHFRLNLANDSFNYAITNRVSPDCYNATAQRNITGYNRTWFVTNSTNVSCTGNCS